MFDADEQERRVNARKDFQDQACMLFDGYINDGLRSMRLLSLQMLP
jgi:hypothetical protein